METGLISASLLPVINEENKSEETFDLEVRVIEGGECYHTLCWLLWFFSSARKISRYWKKSRLYEGQAILEELDGAGEKEDQISGVTNWSVAILDKDPQL